MIDNDSSARGNVTTRSAIHWTFVLALLFHASMTAGVAWAAPLDLVPVLPDILADNINVSYDGAGNFTASGATVSLEMDGLPGPEVQYIGSAWDIVLTLDTVTGAPLGGTLTIGAAAFAVPPAAPTGTLLTADIDLFGFSDVGSSEVLEFIFNTTGGELSGDFAPQVGVILSSSGYVAGAGFDAAFSNSGSSGLADSFVVPEPSSILLFGIGSFTLLAWLGLVRRRRQFNC